MRFIFPLSFIIISAILFFIVANPLYKEVTVLRTDVALYDTALVNSKELQATQDKIFEEYKKITDSDKQRLEVFLPNTANNIRFILEMEQIALLNSMPIKNIKFETPDPSKAPVADTNEISSLKSYGVFPIEFTTEGKYETFALFLKAIENNLRLVDVKSISFKVPDPTDPNLKNNRDQPSDPNVYTYRLKVETYWLK